jgi:hypothetical protein
MEKSVRFDSKLKLSRLHQQIGARTMQASELCGKMPRRIRLGPTGTSEPLGPWLLLFLSQKVKFKLAIFPIT